MLLSEKAGSNLLKKPCLDASNPSLLPFLPFLNMLDLHLLIMML